MRLSFWCQVCGFRGSIDTVAQDTIIAIRGRLVHASCEEIPKFITLVLTSEPFEAPPDLI